MTFYKSLSGNDFFFAELFALSGFQRKKRGAAVNTKKSRSEDQLSLWEKYPFRRALRKVPALQLWIFWFVFSELGQAR
jgi:hypothetical protein